MPAAVLKPKSACSLAAGTTLIVLATDPMARIDIRSSAVNRARLRRGRVDGV